MLSPSLRETNTYGGRHYRRKLSTVWGTAPFRVRFSEGRNRSQAEAGSMIGPVTIPRQSPSRSVKGLLRPC